MAKENIHSTLDQLTVPLGGLSHYGKNPRKGDVAAIAESLERNGQYKPIVVRAGTNEVLAGNHTLKAARELGWEKIAVTFVDVTDDQAARIVLVDNRTNDLAGYDEAALAEMLQDLPDLSGTGFTVDAVEALVHGVEQDAADAPDSADDLPEPPAPIAQLGDIFDLGDHRVICGDSTDPKVLADLLDGEVAHAMWTDPPYGVEYVGKTEDALTIQNDGAEDLDGLLAAAFQACIGALRQGAPVYVAHSDTRRITFEQTMLAAGFLVRQNLVWVKNTMALGHSDYQYKHEPILYGFAPGATGRLGRGGPKWYGPNNATTVFEVDKPSRNADHPTMKPVKLILAMLANSVRPGHLVLDPFADSGSTLIAAHYHGAKARVVELDPRYVDVICARYQKETGELPRRGGKAVDFTREVA